MRKIILLALLSANFFPAISQVTQQWVQRYLTSGNETPAIVKTDGSGNVYVGGGINYGTNDENYAVAKYNSNGLLQWTQFYNGPSNRADRLNAMAVDGSGNVYVTGTGGVLLGGATTTEIVTIKYNSSGVVQWVAKFFRPDTLPSAANAIAVDNAGNVCITGYTIVSPLAYDYITIKYNSAGQEQWVRTFNGIEFGHDNAMFIAVDAPGNVYITGRSNGMIRRLTFTILTGADYVTIKYDPDGNQLWRQSYNGASRDDIPTGLVLDAAANVYVTGESWNGINNDFATVKYTTDGLQVYAVRHNGPANGNDGARGIAVDQTGSAIVTGYSDMGGGLTDYTTIKYDPTGVLQWLSRYNGPAARSDAANAIAVDGFGNVYVTGESSDGFSNDYATVKYGSNGVIQWARRYNGPAFGNDRAVSIAVSMSSGPFFTQASIYVTGASDGVGTSVDFATIKYTQQLIIIGAPSFESNTQLLESKKIPRLFNHPNPFENFTKITYQLPNDSHVSIKLYDILGKEVATLVNTYQKAGVYVKEWQTAGLTRGSYICRLSYLSPIGRIEETRQVLKQ